MRNMLVVVAAAAALMAAPVKAADLPTIPYKALPAAAPVAYAWTGFYLGANAGWGIQNGSEDLSAIGANIASVGSLANGFIGGGQIGFQQRLGGVVLGLETDMDYSNIGGTAAIGVATATANLKWLGSTRLRAGVLLTEQTLAYVTGGVAYGGVSLTGANPFGAMGLSNTRFGWTGGLGVEHVFPNHVTIGVEARYFDLGTPSVTDATGTVTLTNRFNGALGVVKVGYQF
jgi:outer membrane immunogenic protein